MIFAFVLALVSQAPFNPQNLTAEQYRAAVEQSYYKMGFDRPRYNAGELPKAITKRPEGPAVIPYNQPLTHRQKVHLKNQRLAALKKKAQEKSSEAVGEAHINFCPNLPGRIPKVVYSPPSDKQSWIDYLRTVEELLKKSPQNKELLQRRDNAKKIIASPQPTSLPGLRYQKDLWAYIQAVDSAEIPKIQAINIPPNIALQVLGEGLITNDIWNWSDRREVKPSYWLKVKVLEGENKEVECYVVKTQTMMSKQ